MNWSQLQTILWLRWRLTKNQWSRAGQLNAALTAIAMAAGLVVAAGGCVGGILAGSMLLAHAPPQVHLLVWDGIIGVFLFYWGVGVMTELQRSETIDLTRLLHLPVSLKQVFFLNFLASHLSLSLVIFVPAMLGLIGGLAVGEGGRMLGLAPLALGCVFMVTAWTYCLRGWLIALMVNQRRRRTILVVSSLVVVLASQLPNLYFNVFARRLGHGAPRHRAAQDHARKGEFYSAGLLAAHTYVPPLWVPKGAMALSEHNPWPAFWGTLGVWALGALGLGRAYRSTLRFYRGQEGPAPRKAPAAAAPVARSSRPAFLERQIRGLPEPAQALALASLRSLMRAPEIKMALATNLIMLVVFAALFFSGLRTMSDEFKPFLGTAAVVFPFLGIIQLLFNQFGMDRDAFRVFLLLPVQRRDLLLGKNLAFLPVVAVTSGLFLAVLTFALGMPLFVLAAALVQLLGAFLLLCMLGNLASIVAPFRIAPGSLKPTKMPFKSRLLIMVLHLLFPMAMAPILVPPGVAWLVARLGWLPAPITDLLLSLGVTGVIAWGYWASLEGLGELLYRREQSILAVLTQEVE